MNTIFCNLPTDEIRIVGKLVEFGTPDELAWVHRLASDLAALLPEKVDGFLQSVKVCRGNFCISVRCEDAEYAVVAIRKHIVLQEFPTPTVRFATYLIPIRSRDIEGEADDSTYRDVEDDPIFGDCARLTRLDKLRTAGQVG